MKYLVILLALVLLGDLVLLYVIDASLGMIYPLTNGLLYVSM